MTSDQREVEHPERAAYVVTGPTSGYGRAAAFELSRHGTVILVGRNPSRLEAVRSQLQRGGGRAFCVVCDLAEPASVQRAAADILTLNLPIAGVLLNAGIRQTTATRNSLGWDLSFATNHVGPFALAETLMLGLADGTTLVFVVSAVEDPERKPAVAAGFRGGRYVSASSSAMGQWRPGGSTKPGFDAYASSKQAFLAAALGLARATTRLKINAVEPGLAPTTGLGRSEAGPGPRFVLTFIAPLIVRLLMPFMPILTTPQRAARMIKDLVLNAPGASGIYYGERGRPMRGSLLAHDPDFQDRVISETRALLAGAGA